MDKEVTAELISIGDELLIGQTVNTNAAWIGQELSHSGIRPTYVGTIADEKPAILQALSEATADVVLITGGLGPTKDDITKDALCQYFDSELVLNEQVLEKVEQLFALIGRPVLEENRKQALVPAACSVIPNERGTAAGMWFEKGGKVFISMPGVPYEMKDMMSKHILPRLIEKLSPPTIVHRTILTTGLGESHLADRIKKWENALTEDNIHLAYLPSPGIVKLRLSKYNAEPAGAVGALEAQVAKLRMLIPELIFGEGKQTLAEAVGVLLKERGETLVTAESCTGGAVASAITSVSGSSAYFLGAIVSYSNEVKMDMLGVSEVELRKHGAVSEQVVRQMAQGAREKLNADRAIATSGIAGPDGGTEEKPVGTVWLAISGPEGTEAMKIDFPGHRSVVIQRSTHAALNLLRKRLLA